MLCIYSRCFDDARFSLLPLNVNVITATAAIPPPRVLQSESSMLESRPGRNAWAVSMASLKRKQKATTAPKCSHGRNRPWSSIRAKQKPRGMNPKMLIRIEVKRRGGKRMGGGSRGRGCGIIIYPLVFDRLTVLRGSSSVNGLITQA